MRIFCQRPRVCPSGASAAVLRHATFLAQVYRRMLATARVCGSLGSHVTSPTQHNGSRRHARMART